MSVGLISSCRVPTYTYTMYIDLTLAVTCVSWKLPVSGNI